MELFFGEFIKQLIAAIMAIFMPFSTLTAAAPKPVREHINTNHAAYETVCEGADLQAIESWDTGDGTKMSYYDADENTVLDSLTSSIRALFVPMTAYAAEETEEQLVENGKTYKDGTVVLTGTGETDPYIFMNFIDPLAFYEGYDAWSDDHHHAYDNYVLKSGIDSTGGVTVRGTDLFTAAENIGIDLETAETDDDARVLLKEVFKYYLPTYICDFVEDTPDFWTTYAIFNPKHIIVRDGVTAIGFAAFALCTNVTDIRFETAARLRIDSAAFTGTGIRNVQLPDGLVEMGQAVFYNCRNLKYIYLPETVEKIGANTFMNIANDSVIFCESEDFIAVLNDPAFIAAPTSDADFSYDYNYDNIRFTVTTPEVATVADYLEAINQ